MADKPPEIPEPTDDELIAFMRPETKRTWERADLTPQQRSQIWKGNKKRWRKAQRANTEKDKQTDDPNSAPNDFLQGADMAAHGAVLFKKLGESRTAHDPIEDASQEPLKRKGLEISEFAKLYAEQEPSEESQRQTSNSGDAYQHMLEALGKVASEIDLRPTHEALAESLKRVADSIATTPRRSVDDIIKDAIPKYQNVADHYEVPEFRIASMPSSEPQIISETDTPTPDKADANDSDSLPPRWFNRFRWFKWLHSNAVARKLSGGGGVVLTLWIAKQALDYEIDGATKTAALVFLAAWAMLAFAIYVSNTWDKSRPLMSALWIVAGLFLFGVWWAYLPQPPTTTQTVKAVSAEPSPIAAPASTEANASSEERIFTDIDPGYLVGLYKQYSTAQADQAVKTYIGKWIKVTGTVNDVIREDHGREPPTVSVSMYVQRSSKNHDGYTIGALFEDQTSMDRALVLGRKERITVSGKIRRVIEPGILLDNCRFVETPKE